MHFGHIGAYYRQQAFLALAMSIVVGLNDSSWPIKCLGAIAITVLEIMSLSIWLKLEEANNRDDVELSLIASDDPTDV